jgi:parvulin-like peptidyl-prolyl isomerase
MVAAGAFFASVGAAQPISNFLDGIEVVVNNSVITVLQVKDEVYLHLPALQAAYGANPATFYAKANQLRDDELESLEESKLVLDDFVRGEYSTNWVDDALEAALKLDLKDKYSGSRTDLVRTLAAEGRTKEDYRKEMRERVIVRALMDLHTSGGKSVVSPTAIAKYYSDHHDEFKVEDQVKLRIIRISPPLDSPPGASRQMAMEILQKIDGGVPFAEMAKVYSSDEYRNTGGDRGWVERKVLAGPLGEAAFSLKAGQHSPVVELPDERGGGAICYLLMVDDVRPAHASPLTEVQGAIEYKLQLERSKQLLDQWIRRLKAKSHIQTF